jgi:hypothetical protein
MALMSRARIASLKNDLNGYRCLNWEIDLQRIVIFTSFQPSKEVKKSALSSSFDTASPI